MANKRTNYFRFVRVQVMSENCTQFICTKKQKHWTFQVFGLFKLKWCLNFFGLLKKKKTRTCEWKTKTAEIRFLVRASSILKIN